MQKIAQQLDEKIFADWTLGGRGLPQGRGACRDFINQHINRAARWNALNRRFATVATDLNTAARQRRLPHRRYRHGGARLGGRTRRVPARRSSAATSYRRWRPDQPGAECEAQRATWAADIVIAVDISAKPEGQPTDSLTAIMWQTTTIMGGAIATNELKGADVGDPP